MLSIHVPVVVNRHSNYMNERWANSNICHSIRRDRDGTRFKQFELERFFLWATVEETLNSAFSFSSCLFHSRMLTILFYRSCTYLCGIGYFSSLSLALFLSRFHSASLALSSHPPAHILKNYPGRMVQLILNWTQIDQSTQSIDTII